MLDPRVLFGRQFPNVMDPAIVRAQLDPGLNRRLKLLLLDPVELG